MNARTEHRFRIDPTSVAIRLAVAIGLFAYVVWFRTYDITQSFALGGDQMRDWQVALRPFSSLPLSGVSSTAGGSTLGPVYYWFLWLAAHSVGPFVDDLPHAGGLAISVLQSAADVVLFLALCSRLRSLATALLIVLAVATSGYDATLSSTIWNPPVAVAFVKLALAALLWRPMLTWGTAAAAVGASWLAVQCHTASLVVALPAIGWAIAEPLVVRRWRLAAWRLALAGAIVLLLQVPWLIEAARHAGAEPTGITTSLATVIGAPRESIRLGASAELVARSIDFILIAPQTIPSFGALLFAASLVTLFLRDGALVAASVAPVVAAVALFSLWQGRLDQMYWFLVLAPSAAIVLVGWLGRLHARGWMVSLVMLGALLVAQPGRARMAWTFHRMPGYGAMVEGCRAIARDGRPVRDIRLTFRLAPNPDPLWLCSIVGVVIAGDPTPVAFIDEAGRVRYE